MVNHYTADRRIRRDDHYTAGGMAGRRPDRAVTVYAHRCREAFKDVPIVLGGIEASLRRVAQYDHWTEKVRRSVLVDAKADLLIFGNAERALVEVAHLIAKGTHPADIDSVRGIAVMRKVPPAGWTEIDASDIESTEEGARAFPGLLSRCKTREALA